MGELQTGRPLDEIFVDAGTAHWPAWEPGIPCVTIYSPIDGAVSESFAAIPREIVKASRAPAIRENVRLRVSHSGMSVNPLVLLAVADRLCGNVDNWKNFDPLPYRLALALPVLRRGTSRETISKKRRARATRKISGAR